MKRAAIQNGKNIINEFRCRVARSKPALQALRPERGLLSIESTTARFAPTQQVEVVMSKGQDGQNPPNAY